MGTAVSTFLIAAGAILYFAVSKSVSGFNLDSVGVMWMIVGAGGLVISLVLLGTARAQGSRTTVTQPAASVQGGRG
jgi:hypothetical protein